MRDAGSPDDAITEPTTVPPTPLLPTPAPASSTPPSTLSTPSTPAASAATPTTSALPLTSLTTSPATAARSTLAAPPAGSMASPSASTATVGALPPTPGYRPLQDRAHDGPGSGPIVVGLLLILGGAFLLARELLPDVQVTQGWPAAVIGLGLVLMLLAFVRRPRDRAR